MNFITNPTMVNNQSIQTLLDFIVPMLPNNKNKLRFKMLGVYKFFLLKTGGYILLGLKEKDKRSNAVNKWRGL